MEICALEIGFRARVKPMDDDVLHIKCVLDRIKFRLSIDEEISRIQWDRLNEHIEAHLQQLKTKNPPMLKPAMMEVQKVRQVMQQMLPPAPPVTQFPGGQPPGMATAAGGAN